MNQEILSDSALTELSSYTFLPENDSVLLTKP